MDIEYYLTQIFDEFKDYTANADKLCKLLGVDFSGGKLPDYSDENIRQLYLLRYAFAYIFEYMVMYETLFEEYPPKDTLSVTSLGSGAMLDYEGLRRALKKSDGESVAVDYVGIDAVKWKVYDYQTYKSDAVHLWQDNAAHYLDAFDALTSDVYIFPHSISDFSQDDFDAICNVFATKPIKNDRIHILISLRADDGSLQRDFERSVVLADALNRNGYFTESDSKACKKLREFEKGIKAFDNEFTYPEDAKYYLSSLFSKCKERGACTEDYCHDTINRSPALSARKIRVQIMTFERRTRQ